MFDPLLDEWVATAAAWSAAFILVGVIAVVWLRRRTPFAAFQAFAKREAAEPAAPPSSIVSLPTVDRAQLAGLFDHLTYPVWLRAPDLSIMRVNRAFARAIGAGDRASAMLRGCELGQGALGSDGKALARRAQRTGFEQTESVTVVTAGERRLFQFTEQPLPDGWLIGSAQDMTAIDALQADLASHMDAHQTVLEHLKAGIAVFDGNRRLRFVNRAYAELWGLDHDWLQQNPLLSEVLEVLRQKRRLPEVTDYPEFRRRMERRFQTVLSAEESLVHLPDSRCFREVVSPHPLGGLLFVIEDVTDRLALESSYNTLIAVQRGILDQLADGVAAFGSDGRLSVFNPAFLRQLGMAPGQLEPGVHIGNLLERLAPNVREPMDWEQFREIASVAVTGREAAQFRLFLQDGRVTDVGFAPLADGSVLMRVRDITDTYNVERVLLERNAALEETNRLKTDFLANASYELRTPLTSISGFAQMLQSEMSGPLTRQQTDYLEGILQASDILGGLIDSILDVSLGEAGQWEVQEAAVALAPVVESVVAVVRPQIEAQGVSLDISVGPGVPAIYADERRLRQLAYNLITSGARHSRERKHVAFACRAVDGDAELSIRIGTGGQAFGQRLFENELGLTLVQRLTSLFGGRMSIKPDGEDTVIACRLPPQSPGRDDSLTLRQVPLPGGAITPVASEERGG